MSMGLGLGLGLSMQRVSVPTASVAGTTATSFATNPTVQFHPNSQSATLDGSNRVLDCADLRGLAPLLGIAAVQGNKIRNPNAYGAVAGTPGTLPTNWANSSLGTLSLSVVSTGVRNGMQYADLRVFGTTSTTSLNLLPEGSTTNIAAANGQTWTSSNFIAIVGGSTANITNIYQRVSLNDAGGAYLGELVGTPADIKDALTGSLARQTATTGTISNASAAFLRPYINLTFASGVAIDITLRIALPVLEQAASASSVNTVGPTQMTDAWGRKFWRFTAGQYALITNALNAINARQCVVFAVWRNHTLLRGMDMPLISGRYSGYTDDVTNTAQSNGYILRVQCNTGTTEIPRLKAGTVGIFSSGPNGAKMVPGAQLHVAGLNSQTTANGGTSWYMNNDEQTGGAQSSLTYTSNTGLIVGGRATGTNAVTGASDTNFDLYELAFWKGVFTSSQSAAFAAAMVANWSIPAITGQIILEGDSITSALDTASTVVIPADNLAMQITNPGAEMVSTNFRVLNVAVPDSSLVTYGGQTGVLLDAHRDEVTGPFAYVYSGGAANNIIVVNIGINDMKSGNGNVTSATHYTNFCALLNTASTGYLQRGFSVVAVTPTAISGDSTGQSRILAFRDLLIDPTTDIMVSQFLTDTLSNTGQTYDGLVSVLPICKIEYGGSGTIFQTAADAADTTYYSSDGTHLQALSYQIMATGGATLQYGYGPFLLNPGSLVDIPPEPTAPDLPIISGNATTGTTLTSAHATWSETPIGYEYDWQESASPYTNWTSISGATSDTYTLVFGQVGNKVRLGERAEGAGGWSQWVYSDPTGIIASSLPPAAVINTAAQPSPTSGLQIGDSVTIAAPSITGATSWWVSWQRDGVSSEAFATDLDTFPYTYVIQPQDVTTSFILRTYASNANPTVPTSDVEIGPVITGTSAIITDLGSATATENYIRDQLSSNWVKTGTYTQQRTVATPAALKTLWDSEIKVGSTSERWEVTLDWDGPLVYSGNQHTLLSMTAPSGATNWSDAGGWVYLKNASGKKPGFDNRVNFSGVRGIYIEGAHFYGIYTGSGQVLQQGSLVFNSAGGLAKSIFQLYNCRVGRYCRSLTFTPSEVIFGVWADETCEQAVIDTSTFAGNYAAWKIPAKRAIMRNCDVSQCYEDILKAYPLTGSGYYGVYHFDRLTVRDFYLGTSTAGLHTDLIQTNSYDTPLGIMMLMTDCWYVADHKYATGAGGTQGTTLSNTTGYCDNLFCWKNSGVFCTTPVAFSTISDSQYTSYIQNCSLGRAGITPSGYGSFPANKDWSPGFYSPIGPSRSGIGTKIINSTIGQFQAKSWISSSNTTSIDYTVTRSGPIPEDVFVGADFERGGINTSNSIPNKFGYPQDNANQQAFLIWVTNNLITQGAYSSQGPTAPVLANYSAPALG